LKYWDFPEKELGERLTADNHLAPEHDTVAESVKPMLHDDSGVRF